MKIDKEIKNHFKDLYFNLTLSCILDKKYLKLKFLRKAKFDI